MTQRAPVLELKPCPRASVASQLACLLKAGLRRSGMNPDVMISSLCELRVCAARAGSWRLRGLDGGLC